MKNINKYIDAYKKQLEIGEIQKTYKILLNYVMSLKAHLQKQQSDKFSFGNISPGYMDYTYFSFFNEYLRQHKLRFGVVLNHKKMQFELWLMGQNIEIQKKYWLLLKSSKWNNGVDIKPQYSELEIVLVDNPDFEDLDSLTKKIEERLMEEVGDIINFIQK